MSLSVLRGFDLVAPLIITPYLISRVGMEKYGVLAFSLSIAMYFGMFVQYGFNVTAVRDIARSRADHKVLNKKFSAIFWSNLLLAGLAALVFLVGSLAIDMAENFRFILFSAFLLVVLQSVMPTWLFQGLEEMEYLSGFGVLSKLLYLVLVLVFIRVQSDYQWVYVLYAISVAVILIASYVLIACRFKLSFRLSSWREVLEQYKAGWSAFVTQVSPSLYNNSSVFILGAYSTSAVVGAYSAAMTVVEVCISGGRILSAVMLPYLSLRPQAFSRFKYVMLISGLLVGCGVMVFADSLGFLMFGGDEHVKLYIEVMSFGIPAVYAYLAYNTNYLMLNGYEREARRIAVTVSIFFLFVGVVFIPLWAGVGASLVVVLARISMAIFSYRMYKSRAGKVLL